MIYKNGGWCGCGDYLTILATSADRSTQIVSIEAEADGYSHPEMTPHGADHRPIIEYRRCHAGGERTISRATASRWIKKLRAGNP